MKGGYLEKQVKILAGRLETMQNVTIVSSWSLKDH